MKFFIIFAAIAAVAIAYPKPNNLQEIDDALITPHLNPKIKPLLVDAQNFILEELNAGGQSDQETSLESNPDPTSEPDLETESPSSEESEESAEGSSSEENESSEENNTEDPTDPDVGVGIEEVEDGYIYVGPI